MARSLQFPNIFGALQLYLVRVSVFAVGVRYIRERYYCDVPWTAFDVKM